jgi:hypothetical protein
MGTEEVAIVTGSDSAQATGPDVNTATKVGRSAQQIAMDMVSREKAAQSNESGVKPSEVDPELKKVFDKYGTEPEKLAAAIRAAQLETGKYQSERDQLINEMRRQEEYARQPQQEESSNRLVLSQEARDALMLDGDLSVVLPALQPVIKAEAERVIKQRTIEQEFRNIVETNKDLFETYGDEIMREAERMTGDLPGAVEKYRQAVEFSKAQRRIVELEEQLKVHTIPGAAGPVAAPRVPGMQLNTQRESGRRRTVLEIAQDIVASQARV